MPQDIDFGDEIFVVDDDPGVRAALSAVFSREGYRVTCFVDGTSFLAAARARTPACIVLDVHIPGRPGLEVLKELNAHNYAAPIFMVSALMRLPCSGNRCCFTRLAPRAEGGESASFRNKKTSTRFINAPFSERSFSFSIASLGGPALSFTPDR